MQSANQVLVRYRKKTKVLFSANKTTHWSVCSHSISTGNKTVNYSSRIKWGVLGIWFNSSFSQLLAEKVNIIFN